MLSRFVKCATARIENVGISMLVHDEWMGTEVVPAKIQYDFWCDHGREELIKY